MRISNPRRCWCVAGLLASATTLIALTHSAAAEPAGAARFHAQIKPILETHCFGCHGYGASEGGRTLDEFASDEAILADVDLWWAVLKNVRAGLMPPASEEQPSDAERDQLRAWIVADVFGVDPANPDPGHVTLRRLNRVEYRNTIRDLMGVDFDTAEVLPPDDSGFGFDNIGDVLSMSPLLVEKYMQAADTIVAQAVPLESRVVAERSYPGHLFHSADGKKSGNEMSFYQPAEVSFAVPVEQPARYRVIVEVRIDGHWELDPGRCEVTFDIDGEQKFKHEYDWRDEQKLSYEFELDWKAGEHPLRFALRPLVPEDQKLEYLNYRIERVRVEGPLDESHWVRPANYERFFPQGPPPEDTADRDAYARALLADFARRAYRRPADPATVDRLAALAKTIHDRPDEGHPDASFEEGIARAMVAVLASPRFLFRVEEPVAAANQTYPLVDEHALASRLSYFFWSTMPDEELLGLADRSQLRENLDAQVARMQADPRSQQLIENFTGQWLQARDVESVSVDPIAALGHQKQWETLIDRLDELRRLRREKRLQEQQQFQQKAAGRPQLDSPAGGDAEADEQPKDELDVERDKLREEVGRLNELWKHFDADVRWAMRRETEMTFEHVMREDRDVLELVDSDYTFLNAKLAAHYGIPGVEGDEMRLVTLPKDSPRGGVLTQGTLLVVTSNPTRTSPVKRGLYILENILGTPAPPPPNAVPPLEASAEAVDGHEPTLREALELHRSEPICAGCHARFDPLGLALENFNALGMWRDTDRGQPIDTAGTLLTGESFAGIRQLKQVLRNEHRLDFYRCLTEKLLTYALGRGLEYYDEATVDRIVADLEVEGGRFSVLLSGVIVSAPFQKIRPADAPPVEGQSRRDQSSSEPRRLR